MSVCPRLATRFSNDHAMFASVSPPIRSPFRSTSSSRSTRAPRRYGSSSSLPWTGPNAFYGAGARDAARRFESLGLTGIVQGDHPFVPTAPYTSPIAATAAECFTVLTTVAAHSDRLRIATLVANVGIQHPLFLLRRFANLALTHGGERVYAGLGAGWSRRGFEAIGLEMPPHRERLDRLEEAVRLARELFDRGSADLLGNHVVASELPLAPRPEYRRVCSSAAGRNACSSSPAASPTISTWRRLRTGNRATSSSGSC